MTVTELIHSWKTVLLLNERAPLFDEWVVTWPRSAGRGSIPSNWILF